MITQESVNGLLNSIAAISPAEPLLINFASLGGDVGAGFLMYNYFRSLGRQITVKAMGDVASIAIVAFLAFDKRIAVSNSIFQIHRIARGLAGDVNLMMLMDAERYLNIEIDRYISVFKERTAATAKTPLDILQALQGGGEIILDAAAALSAGIVMDVVSR